MKKIQTIEINKLTRGERYTVGQMILVDMNALEITSIKDMTVDGENIYIPTYYVYAAGQLYKSFENSTVTITYFLEGIE